jgi:sarcosine oxidase
MNPRVDVLVLGMGAMGSAALMALASRGVRAIGLEQFSKGHDRGSSHGRSRIIRTAYYEDPCYVPLAIHSFELWRRLEKATGQSLLIPGPCLSLGAEDSELIRGVRASANEHSLDVQALTTAEILRRFPAFTLPSGVMGVIENEAGILKVEACVRAMADQAEAHGAVIRTDTAVRSWTVHSQGITIHLADDSVIEADQLIVTAGAWATQCLSDMGVPLKVMRQTVHWFRDAIDVPIFLQETPGGAFYGLPAIDAHGIKIARHYGEPELSHPREVDWAIQDSDREPVIQYLRGSLPGIRSYHTSAVCMYTLSPDRHFVIDRHPRENRVVVATGFSGHGFKFAPVIGEILADLAIHGATTHEIRRFRVHGRL